MAQIYRATLDPGKLELLTPWLARQPWAGAEAPVQLAAYRFDDPAGEVGIETFLLRTGELVVQVPVTYRSAPLAGAEPHLIGTTEHSVLGTRWVYDGCGDPVWADALDRTIRTGGRQAEEMVEQPEGLRPRTPTMFVVGSSGAPGTEDAPAAAGAGELIEVSQDGDLTVVRAGGRELRLARVVGRLRPAPGGATLTGHWAGGDAVLAELRVAPSLPGWYGELSSALDTRMGLEVLELTPQRVVGRMPVEGNTQPMGLWHGGASCVLIETLASIGSVAHAIPERVAVGVDINATHHRSVRSGWVTGTATAVKLGRTTAMYEVVLVDDDGARVCTGRVTCQLVAARPSRPGPDGG